MCGPFWTRQRIPAEPLRPFARGDNPLATAISICHDQRIGLGPGVETDKRYLLAIVRECRKPFLQLDAHRGRADSEYRPAVDLDRVVALRFRITKIDVVAFR